MYMNSYADISLSISLPSIQNGKNWLIFLM